jgi:putative DNA primase/helicase
MVDERSTDNIIRLAALQRRSAVPTIRIVAGELPRIVAASEQALLTSELPIFVRAGMLVYPVTEVVPASDGRKTITAKLKTVTKDLLLRWLAEAANFERYDARCKTWVTVDPPRQLAGTLIECQDTWPFPRVAGVTTPRAATGRKLFRRAGLRRIDPVVRGG